MDLKRFAQTTNKGEKTMTEFFKTEEYEKVRQQRKKVLMWFFVGVAVYLILSIGVLLWYLTLPYLSPTITTTKIVQFSITGVFVVYAFIYLGIPFKRVNKYFKVTRNMVKGLKETSVGSFFEYDESIQTRDGVEFKSLVFLEWNKYKKDFYERRVLVYIEKDFPTFDKNQNVKYVTQGNKLVSYEIIED